MTGAHVPPTGKYTVGARAAIGTEVTTDGQHRRCVVRA